MNDNRDEIQRLRAMRAEAVSRNDFARLEGVQPAGGAVDPITGLPVGGAPAPERPAPCGQHETRRQADEQALQHDAVVAPSGDGGHERAQHQQPGVAPHERPRQQRIARTRRSHPQQRERDQHARERAP